MSTGPVRKFVPVLITDPSYVKSATEYGENITGDTAGDAAHKTPGSHIRLPLCQAVYAGLTQPGQRFLCPSPEGDEMLLSLGPLYPLREYEYLGSHHSDSGLVCLVREGVYEGLEEELDWLELVADSLDNPREGAVDAEAFPMLQFCATIPEDDSAVAVYGRRTANGQEGDGKETGFASIVLRAWCKAFPEESDLGHVSESSASSSSSRDD